MTVEEFAYNLARRLCESAENARTIVRDGYAVRGPATERGLAYEDVARMVCEVAGVPEPEDVRATNR